MTPAEFFAIAQAKIEQRNEEWRYMDILNGVHCSVLANTHRSASTPPYKAEDFRIMKDKTERQTPEQIMAVMNGMVNRNG
jgi:hypothetical protein